MPYKIMQDVVAKRRAEYPEYDFLSDYQVHSANLVSSTIHGKAQEQSLDASPVYVPFPTGSGKTVGAIWGITKVIEQHPDKRICFLTPYKTAVDQMYQALVKHLGSDKVGMYYSDAAFVDKAAELQKQVVVLTHQFVPYNKGALDDRDLFVIDEAIYATATVTLKLEDFAHALTWATSTGILADEFMEAHQFAFELYGRLKEDEKRRFYPPKEMLERNWAAAISELDLHSELGQTLTNRDAIAGVQIFCEALVLGLVFIDRGQGHDPKKYTPTFNAAILGIPNLDKTVVLTATGGLIYDACGSIKESIASRDYAAPVCYDQVTLTRLPDPDLGTSYKTWTTETKKAEVTNYLDWVLENIEEDEAYVSLPLAVIDKCLRDYFGFGAGDLALPMTVMKNDKQIHVSHHQLAIGTNAYKDCPAVIYLWPNHLPKRVTLQRHTALDGKPLTDESLLLANSRVQQGPFAQMRAAQYVDNIVQQIGRGRIRQMDETGRAGAMTAYLLIQPQDYARLGILMPDATRNELSGYGELHKPTGRMERVIAYLEDNLGKDIPIDDVAGATGIEAKNISKAAKDNIWELTMLGYAFEAGQKGRGRKGLFRWMANDNDNDTKSDKPRG